MSTPGQRAADGVDVRFVRRVDRRRRAGLGQAVGLEDREAERIQIAADRRIELRSAGDEQPHVAAHDVVDLAEEHAAEIDAEPAQPEVQREQRLEQEPRDEARLRDLLHHALMNQVEELRHAREDRDLPLGERLHQIGRVERLEIDDARADRERQQQVRQLRERVKERQHAENRVLVGDVDDSERGITFGQQIRVGQHDAFRIRRRARCVQDHGWRR